MKIVATLACRSNSDRLYGKPLQRLMSTTVLDYMVHRLLEAKRIDEVVLAISEAPGNEAYIHYANSMNLKYVLGDDTDVLKRLIDACVLVGGDTIFRVTTESPLTYLEGLDMAADSHSSKNADYTVFAKLPDGVTFELINLQALRISHEKGTSRHRSELCTLFINENKNDFIVNVLEVPVNLQRPHYRLTIDYPEDLILLRKIFNHFGGDFRYLFYKEVIEYLDANPALREIVESVVDDNYVKPYH